MSRDIWTQCAPKFKFTKYDGKPWRVVEAQHVVATRKLVDSDEEQAILEDLIDSAKPPKPYDEECQSYHYLIWTPFRYPPLPFGSRLGSPDRRGLWYGSKEIETAFAEKAYYTFLFRSGSRTDFGIFDAAITVFRAAVSSSACADMTRPPFGKFESELASPVSYAASQSVGSGLRDRDAEVICFRSARCLDRGHNVAVMKISAFQESRPQDDSSWFCVSSEKTVEFKPVGFQVVAARRTIFNRSDFEVDGKLPAPSMR